MSKLTNKTQRGYTIIMNSIINYPGLSWKAKGIYQFLVSKPDNWDFDTKRIAANSTDGRDATSTGLKELEKVGLLIRTLSRKEDGEFTGYDYEILDSVNGEPVNVKSVNEEHGDIVIKKEVNKEIVNNNNKEQPPKVLENNQELENKIISVEQTTQKTKPKISNKELLEKAKEILEDHGYPMTIGSPLLNNEERIAAIYLAILDSSKKNIDYPSISSLTNWLKNENKNKERRIKDQEVEDMAIAAKKENIKNYAERSFIKKDQPKINPWQAREARRGPVDQNPFKKQPVENN
jgi:hypothetical protein